MKSFGSGFGERVLQARGVVVLPVINRMGRKRWESDPVLMISSRLQLNSFTKILALTCYEFVKN